MTFGILGWILSLLLMDNQRTFNHYQCSQPPQNDTTCSGN